MIGAEKVVCCVCNYRPNPLAEIRSWPAACVAACQVVVARQPLGLLLHLLHTLLTGGDPQGRQARRGRPVHRV